jgi:serine/threonine-protein kinase
VELLRALHEIDPNLPVLLLSGAPNLQTAMKAVEYGAVEYVGKPLDIEKLIESSTRAIALGHKRRADQEALKKFRSGERHRALEREEGDDGLTPGMLLGGVYRVGALIGRGGMGSVYDAYREDQDGARVALKVLRLTMDRDREYVGRFRREAETIAALQHPNIVRMFDFRIATGEPPFLVMERLEGASLAEKIVSDGPFPQRRTAFVGVQMLDALAAAHAARVIHRDMKPENVFLTELAGFQDIVKLLDFGIAKVQSAGGQKLTQTGAVVGTPAYMAPEQARGRPVDARCDVYAVGCVLYEALSGRTAFEAENYNALMFAIQQIEPVSLGVIRPDLDPEFVAIVKKAMAKDPEQRFQTARAMMEALEPWTRR